MIRFSLARAAVILVALASPAGAHAQSAERGFFVGVGGGLSFMNESRADFSRLSGALHLRAGWRLGPSTALMLEASMNGLGSTAPDSTQVFGPGVGSPYYQHFRRTLETETLLASVQLGDPRSFYVRPGVGVSRHKFLVMQPRGGDMIVEEMHGEIGPAVSLAAGRVAPIPGFPLNVEGVASWTGGEDSTRPRWSAGVQIARVIHF
jgi:hypothetical protein